MWNEDDMVNHNCIFVVTASPWRWSEYRPKHVDENIVNKICHRMLKGILLVICLFLDMLHARKMERIKTSNSLLRAETLLSADHVEYFLS